MAQCILVFLWISISMGHAATMTNPSCLPIKNRSQHNSIVLGDVIAPTAQLYFLKNISKKSIWLDHDSKHPSASAGWSSYLRPGQWSALLLDKKDFSLNCAVIQPGRVTYVNCAQAISVCLPPHLVINAKRKGSYWLVEDKSWEDLLKILTKKGVIKGN